MKRIKRQKTLLSISGTVAFILQLGVLGGIDQNTIAFLPGFFIAVASLIVVALCIMKNNALDKELQTLQKMRAARVKQEQLGIKYKKSAARHIPPKQRPASVVTANKSYHCNRHYNSVS